MAVSAQGRPRRAGARASCSVSADRTACDTPDSGPTERDRDARERGPSRALRPCPTQPKVVIVMPAYNAARTLERTYADIPHDLVHHMILVDDVSKDETVEIARQLGLEVIVHRQNLGYGGNQKTCYDRALEWGADVVVMLHPDYQYDATRIPQLVAPILAGERGPDARQPVPRRPARRRHAELEVRLQPVPHRRRERWRSGSTCPSTTRACAPTAGGCSRRSRTASTRDDFVFDQELIAQVVAVGGMRHRRDRGADPLLRGGELRRTSGGAWSTASRPCASSARYLLHRTGLRRSAKLRPRASASEPGSRP